MRAALTTPSHFAGTPRKFRAGEKIVNGATRGLSSGERDAAPPVRLSALHKALGPTRRRTGSGVLSGCIRFTGRFLPERRSSATVFRSTIIAAAFALAAAPASFADGAARSGTFTGASGHEASGGVEVVETDNGYEIRLGADFVFDGAPDPRIGFGNDGACVAETDFEELREDQGAQVYDVPAPIDPHDFDRVYAWRRQYLAPLGFAEIE